MRKYKKRNNRYRATRLNTSGVADIAFLVLIFFLVTASKTPEQGIQAKLVPYNDCNEIGCFFIKKRNILTVRLDGEGQLFVNTKKETIARLSKISKEFITNPNKLETFSERPKNAIIYFFYKKETDYNDYLTALNEIKVGYREIWNEEALKRFGYYYKHLNPNEKRSIRYSFPEYIVEVEPV